VIDIGNGEFKCEKCNKDYQDCNPRMILSVNVADWSNNIWVTLFDDEAQTLLGHKGKEMKEPKEDHADEFNAIFDKLRFTQLQLKLRVKNENYNDEQRLKTTVARLELLKLPEHNKRLLKEINEMKAQLNA
jgi:replication factor A1